MTIDRLSVRRQPAGWPLMHQIWDSLLFLHWPVPPQRLRPLIPGGLEIDTFDDSAWIGVTPFTMRGVRPPLLPPPPLVSRSHEINVRTYVHRDGVPGVWFLSLDANNSLAVLGARLAFHLPYFRARMHLEQEKETIRFSSHRVHGAAPPADFQGAWRLAEGLPEALPGTLEFFLIERYALYARAGGGRLLRGRIHHRPWLLRKAQLLHLSSTMIESHGLPSPQGVPLLHAQAEALRVGIWPLESLSR
jgi:uncharacterized protein